MKFSCDRCGKRYATADEPVPGRVYKLSCKRCGHDIVVRVPSAIVAPLAAHPSPAGPATFEPELEELARPARTPPPVPAPVVEARLAPETPAATDRAPGLAEPSSPVGDEPPARADEVAAGAHHDAPPPDGLATSPGGPRHGPAAREVPEASGPPPRLVDVDVPPSAPPVSREPGLPLDVPPAAPEPPGQRRSFELSRMARGRPDLVPLLLVVLLVVAAIVAAVLFRPERRDGQRPQRPAASPVGAPGTPPAPTR